MNWLRDKLRAWLGIKEYPVIAMTEDIVVPANHKLRVKVNFNPNNSSMTIVAVPKKGKS